MNRTMILVLASVVVTRPGTAQTVDEGPVRFPDSTHERLHGTLAGEAMVRLATIWGDIDLAEPTVTATHVHGQPMRRLFIPDSIEFDNAVPVDWIAGMWVSKKRTAALAGGIGAFFAGIGFALGSASTGTDGTSALVSPTTGAAVLGGVGLLIGSAIGSTQRRWERVYIRPQSGAGVP